MIKKTSILILILIILPIGIQTPKIFAESPDKHISAKSSSCCIDLRGNINADEFDHTDISDLIFLAQILYNDNVDMVCYEETDLDRNSFVDIGDLLYLSNYMFNGGPPPLPCHTTGSE